MTGFPKGQAAIRRYDRHSRDKVQGDIGLGKQEVQLSDKFGIGLKLREIRAQKFRKGEEDSLYLLGFAETQFYDFVFEFHYLRGLDEGGLAAGRAVIDIAGELALVGSVYRNQEFAVSDVNVRIRLGDSLVLGFPQDGSGSFRHRFLLASDFSSQVEELWGGGVLDLAVFVYYILKASSYFGKDCQVGHFLLQQGIDSVFYGGEEVIQFPGYLQQGTEFA